MSIAETYEHEGVTVQIHYDEDGWACDPCDNDNVGIIAGDTRDTRYKVGHEQIDFERIMEDGPIEDYLRETYGARVILPLYRYEHSGVAYSTGAFSCPWDSGQVGFVFDTKENVALCMGDDVTDEQITEALEGEVKTYSSWASGEVYYYVVDPGGPNEDSCGGFVGDIDYAKQEANSAAECVAAQREHETREVAYWAARDVLTTA